MNIEQLFFELLQVAIGTRQSLSVKPTSREWASLFEMAKKQALTAIAMAGVTKLKQSCIIKGGASAEQGRSNPLMSQVSADDGFGGGIGMDEMTYLKWLGLVAKTQQRNKVLNDACASLCKDFAHDGLYACILKGQSNLVNYPERLRDCRTPGDIDVWCGLMDPEGIDIAVADADGKGAHYEKYTGERGVIEWVLADWRSKNQNCGELAKRSRDRLGSPEGMRSTISRTGSDPARDKTVEIPLPEVQYHHIDWEYKGIECEVHFKPSWLNNPIHNARLQRWCKENEQWLVEDAEFTQRCQARLCNFCIPTVGFNAVYQLVHIYRHLFNEGIGLRQLLDYYFVLKSLSDSSLKGEGTAEESSSNQTMGMWDEGLGISKMSKEEIMQTISRLGMKPFASAVMYVLQKVLDPSHPSLKGQEFEDWQKRWPWMICKPDAKRGEFLLNEIMLAGNFGKYDERNVIGANEGYLKRFIRRQKRFLRFLTQYPSEVIWSPYFSVKQRMWRMWHGWR